MWEMLLRSVIGFAVLLVLIRIIGNKQMGQVNVFTYISGTVVGTMVGTFILYLDISLWKSLVCMVVWVGLIVATEIVSMKSVKARGMLDGQPVILIKKGRILYGALQKERLNLDDLTMMLRTNNVFAIADVEYAILEPNGDLSVLKKQDKEGVTKGDMNFGPSPQNYIPTAVVMDGKAMMKNLEELNLGLEWLNGSLMQLGIPDIQQVLYAEVLGDGKVSAQLK